MASVRMEGAFVVFWALRLPRSGGAVRPGTARIEIFPPVRSLGSSGTLAQVIQEYFGLGAELGWHRSRL